MALKVADRVMETTTTTGTGALTLAGAYTGYQRFSAACSTNDTIYYCIEALDSNGNPSGDWEVGLGTYSGTNALTRTTVHFSSNAGSAVNLSAGTKRVFASATATHLGLFNQKANNLSDVASASTARSNLGAAASGAATGSGLTMATSRLLGRTTASTGAVEEITVGSGLSLSSGTLTATGVGGGATGSGYAQYLAALLEPDAIEALQGGTFTYAVASNETKYLLAGWSTQLGGAGRMEQRNPQRPMALRNVTLSGIETGSSSIILNPMTVTYSDPWTTYYSRLQSILELPVKNIPITAASGQRKPLLPGAYGAIITQVTSFDLAWINLWIKDTYGPNLWDEISDASTQRVGNELRLPISKRVAGDIQSSATGTNPDGHGSTGSVSYVLLPSTWSQVPDPVSSSYGFRDDFMGSSTLNTASTWTRAQSTAGNVEINTDYQWCKVKGNGTWGANSARGQATYSRVNGRSLVVDVYAPATATSGQGLAVEWNDGGGFAQTNGTHRLELGSGFVINVKENNVTLANTATWTKGCVYRLMIVLGTSGATYKIQGGKEYPVIGGGTWTTLSSPGTGGTTSNLTPCFGAWGSHDYYVSDVRIFG